MNRVFLVCATTVPGSATCRLSRWRVSCPLGRRPVFAGGQRTFSQSAVCPCGHLRFCCQAAVVRPRVPSLVPGFLYGPEFQAARTSCSSASLRGAPFNEFERLGSHRCVSDTVSNPVRPRHMNCAGRPRAGKYLTGRMTGPYRQRCGCDAERGQTRVAGSRMTTLPQVIRSDGLPMRITI